ncbi:hypothetical protein NQ315_006636 [Exocentrus adspersus]|uniref:Uncharacterized protein n=1 Tax=Exocentrus adspersus TaxID=1586481 RepID=A0AAV8VED5_9CUCU|nr:hypothetical protein NQ315_006636 [Exocentrus adspersus]
MPQSQLTVMPRFCESNVQYIMLNLANLVPEFEKCEKYCIYLGTEVVFLMPQPLANLFQLKSPPCIATYKSLLRQGTPLKFDNDYLIRTAFCKKLNPLTCTDFAKAVA